MNSALASGLFPEIERLTPSGPRKYGGVLTVVENGKGCLDVDTVKGCARGMAAYPDGGCYGECYAAKTAARYGIDFSSSVSRRVHGREHRGTLIRMMNGFPVSWYRVGTAGDPCHDWSGTLSSLRALRHAEKTPVVVTKHEEIYRVAYTRATDGGDEGRKEDLDNAFVRDQLMLEVLLDIRDLFSVAPGAPKPGTSALEALEKLRRLAR